MAEMKKNLPKRAADSARAAKHHERRVRSWVRGEKRTREREKAQAQREKDNRAELDALSREMGVRPATTREVMRDGRVVTRSLQPSKALRRLRRERARRQAA